jgi:hypothetical protein
MDAPEPLVRIVILNFGSDPVEHGNALATRDRLCSRPPLQCEEKENIEGAVAGYDIAGIPQPRRLVRKRHPTPVVISGKEAHLQRGRGERMAGVSLKLK